ncbi:NmrA family NAD(P)-binding protein [Lapillicoccus sp.]|uniref:NmrA family NAD(P)-binding protein n=1 Tax=Lapillicoccus sp. TaxID=1909287 RepID=UPI0025E27530|nr:NmrA family NAD(P)-binding protein [Lapillicoccus sp.]
MTVALTAATGQLGRLVVDALLERLGTERGLESAAVVVAVVRDPAKAADLAERGVTVRVASYEDGVAMEAALAGVDRLLLISGSDVGQRAKQHATVIDAAVAAGVGHITYTSVLGATSSTLPVAPDHRDTEAHLAVIGVPATLLRNGWYHENYVSTVDTARHTGVVLTSVHEGRVASATRADYAQAAAVVLTTPVAELDDVYELSGDVAWTQEDLAAAVTELIGSPVTVARVTPQEQTATLIQVGLDADTAAFVVAIDAATDRGDLAIRTGALARLIGHPTTSLVDGLRPLA